MKKQYTKKQIEEAIAYWKKQLKSMNESTTYVQPKNGKDFLVNDLMQFAQTVKDAGEYDDLVCGLVSTDDEDFGSTGNLIGGYVNGVEKSNGMCVLTLAPYRSGSRRRDISVNSANPISFDQIVSQSTDVGLGAKVAVKMKDPFGIGPNADAVMLAPVIAGKVTSSSYNGVFLLISYDRMQPIDQTLAENKKYTKKQIEEAIKHWKKVLNEFQHDGAHIPRHPSRRNPTDKPTKYYVAVSYNPNFDDGQFVASGGGLTRTASNNDFSRAATTIIPAKAVEMAEKAAAKYGKDMYVFLFKEEYSHGTQTGRDHARSGLRVDKWYPQGQYWSNGLQAVKQLMEDESNLNESRDFNAAKHLSIECSSNLDFEGDFFKEDVEEELADLGIDAREDGQTGWMSYVFGHMFSDADGWSTALEDAILLPNVKKAQISLGNDIVTIVKK